MVGGCPTLDAIDQRVLAGIARACGRTRIERLDAASGTPGWGLDERRAEVCLPDGRRVEFSTRPLLWRLLTTLWERGGRACKEDLARAAWPAEPYHPLRHDNRLQVAVRKLRELIEADRFAPRRVVTTDDGYALGDGLAWYPADTPAEQASEQPGARGA